jgi:hypothetical protein
MYEKVRALGRSDKAEKIVKKVAGRFIPGMEVLASGMHDDECGVAYVLYVIPSGAEGIGMITVGLPPSGRKGQVFETLSGNVGDEDAALGAIENVKAAVAIGKAQAMAMLGLSEGVI